MPDQNNSADTAPNSKNDSKYTAKSEIERVFSVFETFKKDAEEIKSSPADNAPSNDEPVLTMSSIGQLGRFGNQLFQYAFLRICAQGSRARVECPPWIGQSLFGHQDAPIANRLPPAIEQKDNEEALFDVIPEFIPYLEKLAKAKSIRVGAEALNSGIYNVDLWGFFQLHSKVFRPYRKYFCSLFQPVDDLKLVLEEGLNILRSKGKTIIGIHIRRSDYITEPRVGFTLVFPSEWYCQWLEGVWDELEDPVLFLCSDDLDNILPDFEKFSPVTSKDLDVRLPDRIKDLEVDFYSDFFMLSHCDVVCISNSNFSFVACMLNDRAKTFFRPHWDFSTKFAVFDPWDSEPLLWLGGNQPKFLKSLVDVLHTTYFTQGLWAMLKSIFVYVPKSRIKGLGIRAYLGYQVQGIVGVLKSLLYTLGWRSVWKMSKPSHSK
jgi:Glycosyl transferase family 11